MPPRFARNGNLPPGLHTCDWDEFAARYGQGERRSRLLRGLAELLVALACAGCRTAYVDGSFVTRERWPNDFDVCYEPDGMVGMKLDPVLRDFASQRHAQKRRFGGEAFPRDFFSDWSGRTVFEAFACDKATGEAKGLVHLDLAVNSAALERFLRERGINQPGGEAHDNQ